MRYSVHLSDSGLDQESCAAAEARYRAKLESAFGGEDRTIQAYLQWLDLIEHHQTAFEVDAPSSRRWEAALNESHAPGLQGCSLPADFEGHFEIRLVRKG